MKVLHEEKRGMFPLAGKIVFIVLSIGLVIYSYQTPDVEHDPLVFWLVVLPVIILMNALTWMLQLTLKITTYDIRFKYPPFINNWRVIEKEKIKSYELQTYNLFQFGGFGYRLNIVDGSWAYTVFNKWVVYIDRNTKKPLRIGTQHPDKVKSAMEKMMEREEHG